MNANTYNLNVLINTNQPDNQQVQLPVNLIVLLKSNLQVSETTLDFGHVFLEVPKVRFLTLENLGNKPIEISSYSIDNESF